MNKNISCRSKRRKIQEQLLTYNLNESEILENINQDVDNVDIPTRHKTKKNVAPENINISEISLPLEVPIILDKLQTELLNTTNYEIQNMTQIHINDPDTTDDFPLCDNLSSMCSMLLTWSLNYNIPHNALNGLLLILRKHHCFSNIPIDSRTILHTKLINKTSMRVLDSGQYYHFGLKSGIERHFQHDVSEIKLVIGIDGLPIAKSTSSQFWPILAYIRPYNNIVFPIGIYHGNHKPSNCNDFLKDFIIEAKYLISNGITLNNNLYEVTVDVICCDSPAKSFVLMVKGHTGYFSCTRCKIEGEFHENRTCFPYNESDLQPHSRTHNEYVERVDTDYHISLDISNIIQIPRFNVVSNFSLDYMHLICLGTVKKLVLLWKKGPYNVRLPSWKIDNISKDALSLKSSIPCEFSRKPRSLDEFSRFKATELRMYLLYIFPIILKKNMSVDCFKHFMSLNIAMIILLSPDHSSYVSYARDLLNYFVNSFKDIYGGHFISHNIHGLLHVVDDYERYGPLDNCSAFPFENYMQTLKSFIRKPDKPLEQVVLRYQERGQLIKIAKINSTNKDKHALVGHHVNGPLIFNTKSPQYNTLILNNFKFKSKIEADSYFCTNKNEIVKLINIAHSLETHQVILIGKKFKCMQEFYNQPIKSSHFGIYIVKNLSDTLDCWEISDIKKKVMLFSFENKLIVVPFLHSI